MDNNIFDLREFKWVHSMQLSGMLGTEPSEINKVCASY